MALTFTCLSGDSLVSMSSKIQIGVIIRLQINYPVLIYHSSNKTKNGDLGVWKDFSELKQENVVGKFVISYFSYAYMLSLKHWSHWRQNMWDDRGGKNIQDLL